MKNNKGFTLVELVISITLLSIVLVFMMKVLISLKNKEDANGINTKLLVNQTIISKTLNNDNIKNDIKNIQYCEADKKDCVLIEFAIGTSKKLQLLNNANNCYYTISYSDNNFDINSDSIYEFKRTLPNKKNDEGEINYYACYEKFELINLSANYSMLKIPITSTNLEEDFDNYNVFVYYKKNQ